MKKVMFVQNEGNVVGGVWYVNKTIAQQLLKHGYEVQIISLREGRQEVNLEYDNNLIVRSINPDLPWKLMGKREIVMPLKKLKFIRFVLNLKQYISERRQLSKDYINLKKYIKDEKPDYIIASHYMVLDGIPKEFLCKTVHEQHSAFDELYKIRKNRNVLKKYNKSLFGLLWLSKSAFDEAKKMGFKNNFYIYNPIRFQTLESANVLDNKKLVVVSRIEESNKRIGLMIKMVDTVLKNPLLNEWTFDIYGVGEFSKESLEMIKNNPKIQYKGSTDNPMNVLLNSSINLNTSISEGFSLSILEASMCGVPTISFDFGESVYEEIHDGDGIVIKQDDVSNYVLNLTNLMLDSKRLLDYSKSCKTFAQKFIPENIVLDWIKLFEKIDNKSSEE